VLRAIGMGHRITYPITSSKATDAVLGISLVWEAPTDL
jgi:hypothetical protein